MSRLRGFAPTHWAEAKDTSAEEYRELKADASMLC